MKTTSSFIIGLLLLISSSSVSSKKVASTDLSLQKGSISILCTPDLYELTSKWASEYGKLDHGINIKVINADYDNLDLGKGEILSFVSNKSSGASDNENNWKLVVGRDVIVPFINAENPFMTEILHRGVSPEKFAQIFQNPESRNWGNILANGKDAPVHIYVLNDESTNKGLIKFLQAKKIQYVGITAGTKDQVITAIQKDPYAVGFSKIVDIQGTDNQNLVEKVRLLPIDKNGNGSIDYMEDIYMDLNSFQRGVWIGKYPKALYSDIYAVSKVQPTNENELAFLKWVLTDGQQFLNARGFSDLASSESQSQLDKINLAIISEPVSKASHSMLFVLLIIFVAFIIISIVSNVIIHFYKNKKIIIENVGPSLFRGFDENAVLVPNGLYFDKTHTWAFMEKDGMVTIGIDDFLQHVIGSITRIEMKNPGEKINKGDLLCSIIQSGKQLKLYAPVSGTIKKQNEALITNSSYLNLSPYTEGWVYMIEPNNWFREIQLLDMSEKYRRWLVAEFSRLKDFMAAILQVESVEYAYVVMQDGGVLKDGILSDLGPEAWEDFQTNFLDTFK